MTRLFSDLSGRRVIVAGGTSGIGEATAAEFVARGASVLVTGRDLARLEASVARSGAEGLVADAASPDDRAALVAAAGAVDHLVLALSGAAGGGLFDTLDLAGVRAGFEGKVWPQLEVLQALLPALTAEASVVFVTAGSARGALAGTAGLAAINGALESVVGPLATELAPRRVNAVSPGVVDTPWWDHLPAGTRAATLEHVAAGAAVGRVGSPGELADAIVFAATNTYITGAILPVDGGLALPRGT
jgi:NAD(P)-dependent dehydrogenase (short-subunit alcohol dehydrogenase family)